MQFDSGALFKYQCLPRLHLLIKLPKNKTNFCMEQLHLYILMSFREKIEEKGRGWFKTCHKDEGGEEWKSGPGGTRLAPRRCFESSLVCSWLLLGQDMQSVSGWWYEGGCHRPNGDKGHPHPPLTPYPQDSSPPLVFHLCLLEVGKNGWRTFGSRSAQWTRVMIMASKYL